MAANETYIDQFSATLANAVCQATSTLSRFSREPINHHPSRSRKSRRPRRSRNDLGLVAFLLVVTTLASYKALDVADRVALLAHARARHIWLAAAALAIGFGIGSVRFIGMLSLSLNIPFGYDVAITSYSLLIAVLVSWFALHVVTRKSPGAAPLQADARLF